MPQCDAQRTNQ